MFSAFYSLAEQSSFSAFSAVAAGDSPAGLFSGGCALKAFCSAEAAPFTVVIKALEGLVSGLLFSAFKKAFIKQGGRVKKAVFSAVSNVVGGLIMAAGYFLAEGLLLAEGKWQGGLVNLPWNVLQGAVSAIVAAIVLFVCRLDGLFEKILNKSGNGDKGDPGDKSGQGDGKDG